MSKFYKAIFMIALLGLFSMGLYAAPFENPSKFKSVIKHNSDGNVEQYTVLVPGTNGDGNFSIRTIDRIEDKYIVKGVIHIKTKAITSIVSGARFNGINYLNNALNSIKATSIKKFIPSELIISDNQANTFGIDRIYEVRYDSQDDPYNICSELMSNPDVEFACPVYIREQHDFTPNDSNVNLQYGLTILNMFKAWGVTKGSDTVKIAIVDSGVDINHKDLAANIWTNPNEIAGNGVDDDKNGKIDDVHGWDFCATSSISDINSGNFREDNDPTNLVNTHGTSVAGCASATTDNNMGVAGIGFNCKIIPIKCGSSISGVSGIYNGYAGITYAAKLGAQVINCSWGGQGYSASEEAVINYAASKGACLIVSSGNDYSNTDDTKFYPANFSNAFSIGSVTSAKSASDFTNYGYSVGVFAPGSRIYTTDASNQYTTTDGTSFSSPYIAGIAALVKTIHPEWSPQQVYHQIRSTANKNIQETNGSELFFGIADAYQAVTYNSDDQSKQVPGIGIVKSEFTDGLASELIDNTARPYKITLKNYLAPANNCIVTISSPDKGFVITNNSFTLENFDSLTNKTITPTIALTADNPWFSGYMKLVVYYEADNYLDYEMIAIPVNISNNKNTYTIDYELPSSYLPEFYDAYAPSKDVCWYVGYGPLFGNGYNYSGGFLKQTANNYIFYNEVSSSPITAVHAFSASSAYLASSSNYEKKVYYTENTGESWTEKDLSSFTTFINDIHFFENSIGVVIGDPKNGTWGIVRTIDAGTTWESISNPIVSLAAETSINTSSCWYEDKGAFGTTKGRVVYTNNKGASWSTSTISGALEIHYIVFSTALNGMAVFNKQSGANSFLAFTDDGGANWTPTNINLTTLGYDVLSVFNVYNSADFYMLLKNGSVVVTSDKGISWKPILTKRKSGIKIGAAYSYNPNTAIVFDAGTTFGRLNFKYDILNGTRELISLDGNLVQCDTAEVFKNKTKTIKIKNIGNISTDIDVIIIEPGENTNANEFSLVTADISSIEPMETILLRFKFSPKTVGKKTAYLKIRSNAIEPELIITLNAYAKEALPSNTIAFIDGDEHDFGTAKVNDTNTAYIKIKNMGIVDISVSGSEISPGANTATNEFVLNNEFDKVISVGETTEIELNYYPKTKGDKSAVLKIYNSGEITPILLNIKAIAEDGLGIIDRVISNSIISPNPSSDMIYVKFLNSSTPKSLELIDLSGNSVCIKNLNGDIISDYVLDAKDFVSGTYILRIKYSDNKIENKSVTVIK